MHEEGKKLLNLMFKPEEEVCVSPNMYGYHSLSLEKVLSDSVILRPTQESAEKRGLKWEDSWEQCPTDNLLLAALNPIKGYRLDQNVTAHRSFLIELDYGPLDQQIAYIENNGLPYSAMIFSGGKSIHTLITLDQDLPSYEVYYNLAEWILNALPLADQMTKNPSRSIRIPGAEREPGKFQTLVKFNGTVKLNDLAKWLSARIESKPEREERSFIPGEPFAGRIKPWATMKLRLGLDPFKSRNGQWFAIACEFAKAGYSLEQTIDELRDYFQPERDFKEREWKTTIKSGFKHIHENKR